MMIILPAISRRILTALLKLEICMRIQAELKIITFSSTSNILVVSSIPAASFLSDSGSFQIILPCEGQIIPTEVLSPLYHITAYVS